MDPSFSKQSEEQRKQVRDIAANRSQSQSSSPSEEEATAEWDIKDKLVGTSDLLLQSDASLEPAMETLKKVAKTALAQAETSTNSNQATGLLEPETMNWMRKPESIRNWVIIENC